MHRVSGLQGNQADMIGRDDYIDGVDAGDRIVNAVNNVNKVPTPRQAVQLGLTATPKRKDNADTCAFFGEPVFIYPLKDGINDGFLTRASGFGSEQPAEPWQATRAASSA